MKTTRILVATILVAALVFSFAGCSTSSTKLVMGTESGFAPFEYMDGSTMKGIDVDLANAIATEAGKTLSIEDMPFDSLLAAVEGGKIDFAAAGMTVNDERKLSVDFSDPYFDASQVVMVKKGSSIATADDLKNKKIAVQQGTTGDTLATAVSGATVDRPTKFADAVLELEQGKVDAVIIDSFPAQIYAAQYTDLQILAQPLDTEQYAIAVKKGNTALLATINKVIAKMKADGSLDAMVKKYQDTLLG